MPQAKRPTKGKRLNKSLPVLGIAGVSLAASTSGSPADMPSPPFTAPTAGSVADILWQNGTPFQIPLDEEEVSDVSLATFNLFDKEDLGNPRPDIELAAVRRGGGGCRGGVRGCARGCRGGCRACRGCRVGGCGGCGGCGLGWGGGCCLSWGGCRWWC